MPVLSTITSIDGGVERVQVCVSFEPGVTETLLSGEDGKHAALLAIVGGTSAASELTFDSYNETSTVSQTLLPIIAPSAFMTDGRASDGALLYSALGDALRATLSTGGTFTFHVSNDPVAIFRKR